MITIGQVTGWVLFCWCLGGAAVLSWRLVAGWWRRTRAELRSWDATEQQVLDFADTLTGELVDSTGNVVVPAPVNPTPELIARAERAGQFAEVMTIVLTTLERRYYGVGRHRAVGLHDPRRAAIQSITQEFRAIVRHTTGEEPETVGPREDEIRSVWSQPEMLEVVP